MSEEDEAADLVLSHADRVDAITYIYIYTVMCVNSLPTKYRFDNSMSWHNACSSL